MRVLISGASGLVGTALSRSLAADGHEVFSLVRKATSAPDKFLWDPARGEIDARAFRGVDAVVHLAGENVAGARWTESVKARIKQSRVEGTRTLVRALLSLPDEARPSTFVSASATGYYGHTHGRPVDETAARGEGFLAEVCEAWEGETEPLRHKSHLRLVIARFGVVLAEKGGAFEKMALPFKLGVGGPIGDGSAYFPWVHVDDVVGALRYAIDQREVRGVMNVVGPEEATNADLTKTLARVLHRPAFFRVPEAALKLVAGKEMAEEMLLADGRVRPRVLTEAGYPWRFPSLAAALENVTG